MTDASDLNPGDLVNLALANCRVVRVDSGYKGTNVVLEHRSITGSTARVYLSDGSDAEVEIVRPPEPRWRARDVISFPYEGERRMAVRTPDGWFDPATNDEWWSHITISDAWKAGTVQHLVRGEEFDLE